VPAPPPGLLPSVAAPADLAQLVGQFKGTRRELAAYLGWSERTLYRRLKALGLD
jgi:DNA-binding NtrC family response regulator